MTPHKRVCINGACRAFKKNCQCASQHLYYKYRENEVYKHMIFKRMKCREYEPKKGSKE